MTYPLRLYEKDIDQFCEKIMNSDTKNLCEIFMFDYFKDKDNVSKLAFDLFSNQMKKHLLTRKLIMKLKR